MPNYYDLLPTADIEKHGHPRFIERSMNVAQKKRAIQKIIQIKAHLTKLGVPNKKGDNLIVANWNLQGFGQTSRHPEFHYYIAEVMSAFDLIVIQEVRRSIKELQILINILGNNWSYVINDVTEGTSGNRERSAIVYDKRRTDFNGFSGELVVNGGPQIARTPHITGFLSAWKHFSIINVHLPPKKSAADERKKELELILKTMKPKLKTKGLGYENIILSGDFNFYPDKDDDSIRLLADFGFEQIKKLENADTTLGKDELTYDRMFIRRDKYFEVAQDESGQENGGAVEFKTLFKNDLAIYKEMARKDYLSRDSSRVFRESRYEIYFWKDWLSRQMSDHYPIWFEMKTDSSVKYLETALKNL